MKGYLRRVVVSGDIREEDYYQAPRFGHQGRNGPRTREGTASMKRAYEKKAKDELRWILNGNFHDQTDAHVILSWKRGTEPDTPEELVKAAGNFFRRLTYWYRKEGTDLRYVYTIEIGPKGSRHIHAVIGDAIRMGTAIARCWKEGHIQSIPLYSGNYKELADYFCKDGGMVDRSRREAAGRGQKIGRRYRCSRNLRKPKITYREIRTLDLPDEPPERKGYLIDRDRSESWTEEETGIRHIHITYVRERRRNAESRRMHVLPPDKNGGGGRRCNPGRRGPHRNGGMHVSGGRKRKERPEGKKKGNGYD